MARTSARDDFSKPANADPSRARTAARKPTLHDNAILTVEAEKVLVHLFRKQSPVCPALQQLVCAAQQRMSVHVVKNSLEEKPLFTPHGSLVPRRILH